MPSCEYWSDGGVRPMPSYEYWSDGASDQIPSCEFVRQGHQTKYHPVKCSFGQTGTRDQHCAICNTFKNQNFPSAIFFPLLSLMPSLCRILKFVTSFNTNDLVLLTGLAFTRKKSAFFTSSK